MSEQLKQIRAAACRICLLSKANCPSCGWDEYRKDEDMARTLSGKLTGKAAHGYDEISDFASDYQKRLSEVSDKVRAIVGGWELIEIMKRAMVENKNVLDEFQAIIDKHEQQMKIAKIAAEIADEQKQQADEAADITEWLGDTVGEFPIMRQMAHRTDERQPFPQDAEGCGNDYDDLRSFAIGR